MKFLRNLLASCLGTSIAIVLLFFIGTFLLGGIASALGGKNEIVVKKNSILEINLENNVSDYVPKTDNPLGVLFGEEKLQLTSVLNAIENAKYDDRIKGISISNFMVNAGISQTQEIRDKLVEFKEYGKFITAYADLYTSKNYYLSSVADSVYVTPYGNIDFKGLSSERLFYKEFQDKYGVKYEVIRHGKYKSAVEGYLQNEMSDANREQILAFLSSVWNEFLEDISISRNISIDDLNYVADELLARNSDLALQNNMLDGIIYQDEYEEILFSLVGDKVNKVSLDDYISTGKGELKLSSSNKIAVIYAQGEILYGEGNDTYIGEESMIKAIRSVRDNDAIKAVVLRVNSPGGVALTADLIWRELELLKAKKPLVTSMGDYAASGGYYIACNSDKIYAQPTTITGSIGVFGMIPNFSELAKKLGINAEQVATNKRSIGYSVFEPMNKDFYNTTKEGVEQTYLTFLKKVSIGRKMTYDQVDKVAQGRVWTGKEAMKIGLVDELGSLNEAIEGAAELAGLIDYKTTDYPRYELDFEDSLNGFPFIKTKEDFIKEELGVSNYRVYKNIQKQSLHEGVQMRMLYDIDIK